jgi:hypothetical protein
MKKRGYLENRNVMVIISTDSNDVIHDEEASVDINFSVHASTQTEVAWINLKLGMNTFICLQ